MNEYIISERNNGHIVMDNSVNLIFMSVADNLESGGRWIKTEKNYFIGVGTAPDYEMIETSSANDEFGATVTLGGNYLDDDLEEKGNLVYHGENIQDEVAAVRFNGSGNVYFTAQTGATTDAKDSDILVVVTNKYVSPDSEGGSGESVADASYINASQNVSASAFRALKTMNVGGNLSGQLKVSSIGNDFVSYTVESGDSSSKVLMTSGHVINVTSLKGGEVTVQNNSDAVIEVSANAAITHKGDEGAAGTVSNNRIVAAGLWSFGFSINNDAPENYVGYEDEKDIPSSITIKGYLGGKITVVNGALAEESGESGDGAVTPGPGPIEGEESETAESAGQNLFIANAANNTDQLGTQMTVTGNTVGAYGLLADDNTGVTEEIIDSEGESSEIESMSRINLGGFTGEIEVSSIGNTFSAIVAGGDENATTSITNNTVAAAGMKANQINIDKKFTGTITVESSKNTFTTEMSAPEADNNVVTDNLVEVIGLDVVSKDGVEGAGTLNSASSMAGSINITSYDNTNDTYYDGINGYKWNVVGIRADKIDVKGDLGTDISVLTGRSNGYHGEGMVAGIYVDNISADFISSDITIVADELERPLRVVGIFVENGFDNGITYGDNRKDTFDFTGNLIMQDNELEGKSNAIVAGMMGFKDGVNLRVSGTILAVGPYGAATTYSIVADRINEDLSTTRYGTDDYVELAAGSLCCGSIELSNGSNTVVIDSNSKFAGTMTANLGELSVEFKLNEHAMAYVEDIEYDFDIDWPADCIVYTSDNYGAAWLASTTNITVDMNDAEAGERYHLFRIEDMRNEDWQKRKIAITYQGHTAEIMVGEEFSNEYFSVTSEIIYNEESGIGDIFFMVEELNGNQFAAPVVSSDVVYDDEEETITLSWKSTNPSSKIEVFELEYRIDDGNSVVVYIDGDESEYEFKNLMAGQTVEWRVREHLVDKDLYVSDWSEETSFTVKPEDTKFENVGSGQYDNNADKGAVTPTATLTWATAECEAGVAYYELRYYQGADSSAPDWDSVEYKTKVVSGNMCIVSGLTNMSYVHWQIRAVDNNGLASDWSDGQTLRVYAGDTRAPEFDTSSVRSIITFDPTAPENQMMQITVSWDPAEDVDMKSGLAGYDISYRLVKGEDSYGEWFTVRVGADETSLKLNLANGVYEWKISASDYAGNRTEEFYGTNWAGDFMAPEFVDGEANLTVDVLNTSNNNNEIKLSWNPAEDTDGGIGNIFQSGLKEYVLYYKAEGADDSTAKKIKINADQTSYIFSSKDAKLTDGKYEWWIVATDNAKNEIVTDKSTFSVDTKSPTGGFTGISDVKPTISVNWEEVEGTDPVTGETIVTSYTATNISIKFDIQSEFTDANDIYFIIQFSGNDEFTDVSEYTFARNTESNITTVTFNDSFELGAGGIAKYDKIYYRIQAVDSLGNRNATWAMSGNYFQLIDEATGRRITDTTAPTKVTDVEYKRNGSDLTVSWDGATDTFGVRYYDIYLNGKKVAEGVRDTKYTIQNVAEGKYSLQVQAVDWAGHRSENSTGVNVIMDVTAPEFNVNSVSSSVVGKDACVTWEKAEDNYDFGYYEIRYSSWDAVAGGFTAWISTKVYDQKQTEFWFSNWSNGQTIYQVRAVDAAGNASEWSSADNSFVIDTASDAGDTMTKAMTLEWGQDMTNTIGRGDTADFYKFAMSSSGEVTITISDLKAVGSSGSGSVKVTIYDAYGKSLKSFSVSGSNPKSYSVLVEKLGTGYCYVGITPSSSDKVSEYVIEGNVDYFEPATSNSSFASAEVVTLNPMGGAEFTGWVGFGDAVDYYKLDAAVAGSMNLSISGLEGKVTITVYDNNKKKIKSVSVSADKENVMTDVLVPVGSYITITSGDNGKGKENTGYTVIVNDNYFQPATPNDDFSSAAVIALDENGYGKTTGWVGYGDAVDYYKLGSAAAGTLDLSISGLTGKVTVALYDENGKKLKSVSVSKDTENIFKDVLIPNGAYVTVTSGDNGKGKENTEYELVVKDDYFPAATPNDDFDSAKKIEIAEDGSLVFSDWVGYGDATDVYLIDAANAGMLDYLKISHLEGSVKVEVYDLNGKKLKSVSVKNDGNILDEILVPGDFYITVTSGDNGKGKQNTGYEIVGGVTYFPEPTDNNTIATADTVTLDENGFGTITGWVGYGDAVNYYKLDTAAAGTLNLSVSGLEGKVNVVLYDADGKKLKSVSVSKDSTNIFKDVLVPNGAYISVTSGDNGKGKENTNFTLTVDDTYFQPASPNVDFETAQLVALDENGAGMFVGWVGYGDAVDYYKLDTAAAGILNLSVSGLEGKVTVTLYDIDGKKLKSVSVSKDTENIFKDILVPNGAYVTVASGDNGKGKENTSYVISVNDSYFPAATDNNTIATATAVALGETGAATLEGWVGYGDAVNYYRLNGDAHAGTLNVSLSRLDSKVTVALYDVNGKKLKSVSVSKDTENIFKDILVPGNAAYLSVTSGDNGKGKQNSDYVLTVQENYFPAATDNNTFNTASDVTLVDGAAVEKGWVGYGDASDFYRLNMGNAGLLDLSVANVTDKVSVAVYDAQGKKLKSFSVNSGDKLLLDDYLLTSGVSYISVTSGDNGKGKNNSSYELIIGAEVFPAASDNNSMASAFAFEFDEAGKATVTDWVGYGNEEDFFKFEIGEDGGNVALDLKLDDESLRIGNEVLFSLYNEEGKTLLNIKNGVMQDSLAAGTYYVSVEVKDEKKHNTSYSLGVTLA